MPRNVDGSAQAVLERAVEELNRKKCIENEDISLVLTPFKFPPYNESLERQIRQIINKLNDRDWKAVFINLTEACKYAQNFNINDSEEVANQSSENTEDQKLLVFSKLIDNVKLLTRIAGSKPLWATKIMSANCAELAQLSCSIHKKELLEEAAAVIRQSFRITVSDYENEESLHGRTLKCYDVSVSLIRVYVSMHGYSLVEGILHAVNQYSRSIPNLAESPWKTQVQFLFYKGTYCFYEQKYNEAMECFDKALSVAEKLTDVQLERIMIFSIPASYLVLNKVPKEETWERLPRLKELYGQLIQSCRSGNYDEYVKQMRKNGDVLRANRLYLACDSMLMRLKLNLLRRCWTALGRPKRLPIGAYSKALRAANLIPHKVSQHYAAEFYISQFILKGEVKGYVHHELRLLMLSKTKPFPSLLTIGAAEQ